MKMHAATNERLPKIKKNQVDGRRSAVLIVNFHENERLPKISLVDAHLWPRAFSL